MTNAQIELFLYNLDNDGNKVDCLRAFKDENGCFYSVNEDGSTEPVINKLVCDGWSVKGIVLGRSLDFYNEGGADIEQEKLVVHRFSVHDELVAVLEEIVAFWDYHQAGGSPLGDKARAIIAKAKAGAA